MMTSTPTQGNEADETRTPEISQRSNRHPLVVISGSWVTGLGTLHLTTYGEVCTYLPTYLGTYLSMLPLGTLVNSGTD